jgi:hypothetical protein
MAICIRRSGVMDAARAFPPSLAMSVMVIMPAGYATEASGQGLAMCNGRCT